MNSVAVLTRIYPGELPYLHNFINYYFKIGVDKIYFLNTHSDNIEDITNYLSSNKNFDKIIIENLPKDKEINLIGSQTLLLSKIKEDYTLNIDADEYLKVNNIKELCNNLNEKQIPIVNFRWYMNFNDGFVFKNDNLGFKIWNEGKILFKTNIAKTIYDHTIITNDDKKHNFPISNIPLIHIWCRNFNDIIIKSINQRFNDLKSSNLELLKNDIKKLTIPTRLKLLAYLINLDGDLINPQFDYEIDIKKEKELVFSKLSQNEYNKIFKIYLCYKFYYSCKKNIKIQPLTHNAYISKRVKELQEFNLDLNKDSNELKLPSIGNLLLQQHTENKYILIPQKFIVNDDNIKLFPACDILLRNFENTFINNKKILVSLHPVCKLYLFYKYLFNYTEDNIRILSFKNKIKDCTNFDDFIIKFINHINITKYIFTQEQIKLLFTDYKLNIYDIVIIDYETLLKDDISPIINEQISLQLLKELKTKIVKNKYYKSFNDIKEELTEHSLNIIKYKYELDYSILNY